MRTPFLVGKTIYLRPLESDDGPNFARWSREAEIGGRFDSGFPVGEESGRRLVEAVARDEHQVGMAVARRADDKLVATLRLHSLQPQRRSGAYRLALDPEARGAERIAVEATRLVLAYAFETLNLNRLWLHEFATNQAARERWAKRGFVEEGILRQEAWREGRYEDVVVMSILREEWDRRARTR
jgi:diamine N-acetyltransferase